MFNQLGLIGCGMMGGSFALALRRAGLVKQVVGYSRSPSTTAQAVELGVIDIAAQSAPMAVVGSDIVLLAVPVAATESSLRAIAEALGPGVLVMDVGSTKGDVVDTVRRVLKERCGGFVPAHPIAGSERAGVAHADAALFDQRRVILTPIAQTLPEMLLLADKLWQALGAQVLQMTPEDHDAAFAAVSHLPHLVAFAYISAIAGQPAGRDFLSLAGSGFRDFSRIAASDPAMWRDVLLANRAEVMRQAKLFRSSFDEFMHAMLSGDGPTLEALISKASVVRHDWQIGGSGQGTGR